MNPDRERIHLAQAERHVTECNIHIARQRALIRRMILRGLPTQWAEEALTAFEASLCAFERHRELILAALGEQTKPHRPPTEPRGVSGEVS